jgi:hypothetical protein
MAQRRPRPTKRFRIGRSCARVGILPRAGWLFLCVARLSARPLNTRMVCSGVAHVLMQQESNQIAWAIASSIEPRGPKLHSFSNS